MMLSVALVLIPLLTVTTPSGAGAAASATVTIDPTASAGPLTTQLSTNLVYPNILEGITGAQARLNALAPPLLRIHAGTDGTSPGNKPALPAGEIRGDWDFGQLNTLVNNVRAYGDRPLLNVRYAPNWMWTCEAPFTGDEQSVGQVRDQSFGEFAAYLARLVAYYNTGAMTTEAGQVVANPAGTANRIDYWELWNEPNLSNETPCHPADWGPALTPAQYLAMWNAAAPAMRAVDSTITLVGPATANAVTGQEPEYVPTLLSGATIAPDVVSFHGYGGWENTQGDQEIFDGGANTDGLAAIAAGLARVHAWAGARPVWVTEINVDADYGDDPAGRPWGAYGVAWGASAFRALALGGAGLVHQYAFIAGPQFAMVDETSGQVYLPYWRDLLLGQAFPAGSAILGGTSSQQGVEVLAVRRPGGSLGVLVVNRQANADTASGGPGLPANVTVDLGLNPSGLRLRQVDAGTNATSGPVAQVLAPGRTVQLDFSGYGMAVLDVDVAGPDPSPFVPLTLGTNGAGSIVRSPAGNGGNPPEYPRGMTVTLTPQPSAGNTFVGWQVDGQFQGWAEPLSITMGAAHTIVAMFASQRTFIDVRPDQPYTQALAALALRGYIRGYGDGRFGPDDALLRVQIAALIARAMGYTDAPPNPFTDRCARADPTNCVDDELWKRVAELAARQFAKGYSDVPTCTPPGVPCFAPRDGVLRVQVLSLIARAMIEARYWERQPGDPTLYGGVLNRTDHGQDVATYLFYTQGMRGTPNYPVEGNFTGWDQASSRDWSAQALWVALNSYWSVDRVP